MSEPDRPMASAHAARAALYSFAAGTFLYPTEELLDDLTAPETRDGVASAADRLGVTAEADALLEALSEPALERLADAYNDLFGVPTESGSYAVVPYEAHYTAGDDIGHQQRRIATVVGLFEAVGLEPGASFEERQDHVAAELELMQVLSARRAVAAETGDGDEDTVERIEATVLDEHLVGFVPAFAHEVRQATDDPVYVAAATLAERLVKLDHERHEDTPVATSAGGEVSG